MSTSSSPSMASPICAGALLVNARSAFARSRIPIFEIASSKDGTMQSDSGIQVERIGDGIVQIRLDRPERLNALGVDMVDALNEAIVDAIAERARVLLVRG